MAKISLLTAAALLLSAGQAALAAPDVKDKYIIKLKSHADQGQFTTQLHGHIHAENARDDKTVDHQLIHTYTIGNFKGYAGKFSVESVQRLRKDPMVESITEDKIVRAVNVQKLRKDPMTLSDPSDGTMHTDNVQKLRKDPMTLSDPSDGTMHTDNVQKLRKDPMTLSDPSDGTMHTENVQKLRKDPMTLSDPSDGTMHTDNVQKLRKDPMTLSDPSDGTMHALGTQQSPPSWGLRRISEHALDLEQPYTYPDTAGAGVTAYIIDTGVMIDHPDIKGRATWGLTACDGCKDVDDVGHGTHVATTIGGTTYGVAKKVNLVAVKVLGGDGSGTNSGVIAGINWVADQVKKNPGKPAVANMSLGGDKSQELNDAVSAAVAAGVVFGVAAGNDHKDACEGSPSSTPEAICVAASDNTDTRASFSDYGSCVSIFAPGVDITAGWNDGNSQTISGTSMATPHVVGVAALYLGENPSLTPAQVKSQMLDAATKDLMKDPKGSANLFVYNVAKGDKPQPPPSKPTEPPTKPTEP
ncbi:hypothetical protein RI367_007764, partial [Sorochytrium milnesiophthora]